MGKESTLSAAGAALALLVILMAASGDSKRTNPDKSPALYSTNWQEEQGERGEEGRGRGKEGEMCKS